MAIRVDDTQFEEKGRLAGVAIALFTMRAMERWRAHLTDYDCVMIMISVVAITSEPLLRAQLEPEETRLSAPIDRTKLRRANVSSIAHATGLNRETTRRKVNDLIRQELLFRFEDGAIGFRPGLVQEDRIRDQIRGQLSDIAAVTNQLMRIGVLAED